ncbi:hypothetical protein [Sphingomonas sp. RS2018]
MSQRIVAAADGGGNMQIATRQDDREGLARTVVIELFDAREYAHIEVRGQGGEARRPFLGRIDEQPQRRGRGRQMLGQEND